MGFILFITAIFFEIAFAIYCIITKSNNFIKKSIIRIAFFVSFLMLTVFNVFDWTFRYYAFTFFFLCLSIIGAIIIIKKKKEKREYKTISTILKAIAMIVLIFTLSLPAIIFPQNIALVDATGEYQFLTKTFTYIDTNRIESYTDKGEKRKLNVQFWYPDNLNKTYPLVVFSHGGLGIKTSNESLYNELASHGYVLHRSYLPILLYYR